MSKGNKTIIRKLNTSSGFTLAEALVAILILLMVSSIVATGIPVAKNAYEKVVLASNAEVLLSTTISSLRNELGTASNVVIGEDNTTITYFNSSIKATSMITLNSAQQQESRLGNEPDGVIVYQRYAGATIGETEETSDVTRLVSSQASTHGLYATYESVTENNDGTITFNNLSVNQANQDGTADIMTGLTTRPQLSIRIISY